MKTLWMTLVLGTLSISVQAGLLEGRDLAAEIEKDASKAEVEQPSITQLEAKMNERLDELENQLYVQSRRLEKMFLKMTFLTLFGILLGITVGYSVARREKYSRGTGKAAEKAVNDAEQLAFEAKLLHVNTVIESYKNRSA